eukprot:SAG31_NODE_45481_length_258_cov_1.308176_1_plen_46_part_10
MLKEAGRTIIAFTNPVVTELDGEDVTDGEDAHAAAHGRLDGTYNAS